jgi:hypothetical protein
MADGFAPPQGVRDNAKRGLELRREFNRGGTAVGVARARDLSNGKSLPLETINRMVSYFARHEVDKKGENWGNASDPSRGYIAWLLWGGDAGKTWADSIAEREKKKDKSMTADFTNSYAAIIKQEKQEDGTLLVYGKATDDSIDIDQQICDAGWLETAMPQWFKTGGNIREQHSNIAAGVAKELDSKPDGHYISALVVDPISVKKVETGVLKGFSIGIRAPRIVRDQKAANGRIIDGQIVEISLVDRPANPNAKLTLAKSDNGGDLEKVEEFIEKHGDHDQADHNPNEGGSGSSNENSGRNNSIASEASDDLGNAHYDVTDLSDEMANAGDPESAEAADRAADNINSANENLEAAQNATTDEDHTAYLEDAMADIEAANSALSDVDSGKADDISDDLGSIHQGIEEYLDGFYGRGEEKTTTAEIAKGEKMEHEEDKAVSEKPLSKETALRRLEMARKRYEKMEAMCKEAGYLEEEAEKEEDLKPVGESAEEETEEGSKPEAAQEEVEEAEGKKPLDKAEKCLECGCDQPSDAHGRKDVSTATMISPTDTPKSIDTIVPPTHIEEIGTVIEDEDDEDSTEDVDLSAIDEKAVNAIITKAVKSATQSVTTEINSYKEEINKLQSELATAKTKAVSGGPKRAAIKVDVQQMSELLAKAAEYRAKSAVTADKDLARGYRELASDFEAKAAVLKPSN